MLQNMMKYYGVQAVLYSTIIGGGKYWQRVHLEGMMRKYLANLNLNKTTYIYVINIAP